MNKTWILCVGAALAPAVVSAAPGDRFVTENQNGSVLEWSEGGDFTDAERFATGLTTPTGMCIGPGGHIYVAETNAGEITIIDDGGDMTDEEPFAFGVAGIASLWCDEDRLVISCPACPVTGVIEIDQGGNIIDNVTLLAFNVGLTGDVVYASDGRLLAAAGDVYDITAGGDFAEAEPYTTGVSMLSALSLDGVLIGGEFGGTRIFDFTEGGDLTMAEPWAELPTDADVNVQALLHAPGDTNYAVLGEEIYDIGAGGDLTAASPVAWGLATGNIGVQAMLDHVCSTNDDCADDDLCNGDELCVNNECFEPEGPPDCDDDDVCTSDSCDSEQGCDNDPIEGCCLVDLDCAVDEFCDAARNTCVPTGVPPGDDDDDDDDDDDTGGDDTGDDDDDDDDDAGPGDSGGLDPTDGGDESGDGDPGADTDAEGCSCRSGGSSGWAFLLLPLFVRLRRTRRH